MVTYLSHWEPHLNTISYIRDLDLNTIAVRLHRENGKPVKWIAEKDGKEYPCSDYTLWAPFYNDWVYHDLNIKI